MALWSKLRGNQQQDYERYLFPGLLLLVILNVLVVLMATASIIALTRARAVSRQANTTNVQLEQVYTGLREAEAGQRGYIITGDTSYLAPYAAGSQQVPRVLKILGSQITNPKQQTQLQQVTALANRKLSVLAQTITIRRDQGFEAAAAAINTNLGRDVMNQAHAILLNMEQQNSAKITTGTRTVGNLAWFACISLLVSLLLTAGFAYFIRRLFQESNRRSTLLGKTNSELNRSNRELQDFASVASHDLQEPLRKIQAFGDRLLSSAELTEESQLYLGRMLNASERMRSLIDDLLAFSRVTTKAKPFKRVSLNTIVKEVLSDLEIKMEDTLALVTIKKLPAIDADAFQMRQVFQNLISNGLKFQQAGIKPEITISSVTSQQDGAAVATISVQDNGIGFDTKYLDRIFTIFQRLHGRNDYEGTGIGLAVVRKIAERHGGSVTAASTPGNGACFKVTLPIHQQQVKTETTEEA